MDSYLEHLDTTPKTKSFQIGLENAKAVIKSRGIQLSPEALKNIASDFLAETRRDRNIAAAFNRSIRSNG